jgi:hypothetical protein
MVVATEARQASFTVKAEAPQQLPAFLEVWRAVMAAFYR